MGTYYLPGNDSEFSGWVDRFLSYIGIHQAELGLTPADLDQIVIDHPRWDDALEAHQVTHNAAKSATETKNSDRAALEATIRILVKKINANPAVTDAVREQLGLTPLNSDGAVATPISESDDRPHGVVEISSPLRHVLRIENQNETGTSKGKPSNATVCEVWRTVGEPPVEGDANLTYVCAVSRNKLVIDYPVSEGGKQAYYKLRWANGQGQTSSWSDLTSATIAA